MGFNVMRGETKRGLKCKECKQQSTDLCIVYAGYIGGYATKVNLCMTCFNRLLDYATKAYANDTRSAVGAGDTRQSIGTRLSID